MPEERSDPVWLDDIESPPEPRSPKRLCIISGDALPSGEFIAALQTAVGPNQEIEIIRERRRGGSGTGPGQPPIERRQHTHVEAMVRLDGYAIVPLPPSASRPARVPDPPISIPAIERPMSVPPIERPMSVPIERRPAETRSAERSPFLRRAFGGESETDELELQRVMEFKRRRRMRLGFPLVVTALVAVLTLLFFQLPAVKSFMSRVGTPPAERAAEPSRSAQAPSPGTPSAPDRRGESRPSAGQEGAERAPEPGVAPRAQVGTTPPAPTSPAPQVQSSIPAPPAQTGPTPPARTSSAPKAETIPAPRVQPTPAPRVEPGPAPRAQPGPAPRAEVPETRPQTDSGAVLPPSRVSPRQVAVGRASETLRGEASRFPGVPRVELTRSSLPTPEGKAESYVVRLSDPAGRPLAGAEVLLLAGMSDGTVESIMLHDGPEPGTYSGTSRPTRSAPVDLRVRMTMSDKRIEVPLRP